MVAMKYLLATLVPFGLARTLSSQEISREESGKEIRE